MYIKNKTNDFEHLKNCIFAKNQALKTKKKSTTTYYENRNHPRGQNAT
jgi:hypothetical protein